ncbi:hypothetical protein LMG29542_07794 [Paraburkholderia humisilvae]|uniref:Uncharacterized protein n=1 Tax=Paraburkholderia humisilvae TaxID=627669 RepID=A0A6J5FB16_9BURK|nr:hypothetical protein LMG29542_07794 [Paraburkholderia humisilvae]
MATLRGVAAQIVEYVQGVAEGTLRNYDPPGLCGRREKGGERLEDLSVVLWARHITRK